MKNVLIGQSNTLILASALVTADALVVTASIVGESGTIINDDSGNPQTGIACINVSGAYQFSFTPDDTLPNQYLRVYWNCTTIQVEDIFSPESYSLTQANPVSTEGQVMPVDVFLNEYIASASKLDDDYIDAVNAYVTQ